MNESAGRWKQSKISDRSLEKVPLTDAAVQTIEPIILRAVKIHFSLNLRRKNHLKTDFHQHVAGITTTQVFRLATILRNSSVFPIVADVSR